MIAAGIAAWLIGCAFMAYLIITAPFGFEDAQYGFRYGEQEDGQ